MIITPTNTSGVYDSKDDETASKIGKRVIGHNFNFARWEYRYQKEFKEGKIIEISDNIAIDKTSITSVDHSIYDKELGDLTDTDKDIREFTCDCGELTGRFYEGNVCPSCGTVVRERYGMDIRSVGWVDLHPYYIITPNAFEMIAKVTGLKTLQTILSFDIKIDLDGNLKTSETDVDNGYRREKKKTNVVPYANYGMIEFRKHFVEIITYYAQIKGLKQEADYLISHMDLVFSSKIPIASTYLRPTFVSSKKRTVSFDKINAIYVELLTNAKLLKRIITKDVEIQRSLNLIYDIQMNLRDLYHTAIKTKLSGKNKIVRGSTLGNRMNFSGRFVIRSYVGVDADIDKIEMSYKGFLELNLLEVINVLMRGYVNPRYTKMTVYEVLDYVRRAQYSNKIDPDMWDACDMLLKKRPYNSVVVLRPPALALGSLQCFDVNRISPDPLDKTIALSLGCLKELNADFDGDCLSVYWPKEKRVIEAFRAALSPKALAIDRCGDKYFNDAFSVIKDEITSLISALEDSAA